MTFAYFKTHNCRPTTTHNRQPNYFQTFFLTLYYITIKVHTDDTDISDKKSKNGYLIGQLKEMPGVFTQGLTIDEVKENILDSLEL